MRTRRKMWIGMFGALLGCMFLAGCCFRALTERDVIGTYEANADWGRSTLVLHADHSFEQRVVRDDHTEARTKGTWELDFVPGMNRSGGILALKPFLDVTHDHKGVPAGGAAPSIGRDFLWGISIAADPDYGISFEKN